MRYVGRAGRGPEHVSWGTLILLCQCAKPLRLVFCSAMKLYLLMSTRRRMLICSSTQRVKLRNVLLLPFQGKGARICPRAYRHCRTVTETGVRHCTVSNLRSILSDEMDLEMARKKPKRGLETCWCQLSGPGTAIYISISERRTVLYTVARERAWFLFVGYWAFHMTRTGTSCQLFSYCIFPPFSPWILHCLWLPMA